MARSDEELAAAFAVRFGMTGSAGAVGAGGVGGSSGLAAGGLGAGDCESQPSVGYLMGIGAPTIALARARGDLVPSSINVRGTFPSADSTEPLVDLIADEQSKVQQDCLVRSVTYQILNEGETANATSGQIIGDAYFAFSQSGIEVKMLIKGRPGASPCAFYTPIAHVPAACGGGWTLRCYEQPFLSFRAVQDLPFTQTLVVVTFAVWAPRCYDDAYQSNRLAVEALQKEFDLCGGCKQG